MDILNWFLGDKDNLGKTTKKIKFELAELTKDYTTVFRDVSIPCLHKTITSKKRLNYSYNKISQIHVQKKKVDEILMNRRVSMGKVLCWIQGGFEVCNIDAAGMNLNTCNTRAYIKRGTSNTRMLVPAKSQNISRLLMVSVHRVVGLSCS